ncbi:MAG: hypothetical protein JSS56_24085 [Proteobacteria bacterium]|nr:hypothetical protein [Pseudomonadota bacterium]
MEKIEVLTKSVAACAVALVIAGCGGGGGSNSGGPVAATTPPATTADDPSLQLSGTAATGAALVDASVAVKCASGEGTATTDANGTYSLKLTGGALPCVIKVTGTQGGVEVTLHSLTEAGTAGADGVTSAAANVTPLTELVVAQLTAGLPADFFTEFNATSGAQVSTEKLVAATQAVLTALKDATGIDLGAIDPFKTTLVAATTSAPDGGNAYDKLLDQLGEKVSTESLPQIVTQVAAAAATGDTSGLGEAMTSVENGSLPGCPVAVSGKYRNLDYFGRINVRELNFKTMKTSAEDGTPLYDITADPAKPCEFTVAGTANGTTVRLDMVMGPSGIATGTIQNFTSGKSSLAYMFPVQSHPVSALAGDWTYLQSGFSGPNSSFVNWLGKFNITADGGITACDYDYGAGDPSVCLPNSATRSVAARTDGGFDLSKNGSVVASLYGYRTPDGTLTVFATQNPAGANDPTAMQTSMLLSQMKTLSMPAVGAVSSYWDVLLSQNSGVRTVSVTPNSTTITAVDGDTATRTRTSDGRVDTVRYNYPVPGHRYRAAGTNFGATYQLPMRGTGFTVHINAVPGGPGQQSYSVSMNRK